MSSRQLVKRTKADQIPLEIPGHQTNLDLFDDEKVCAAVGLPWENCFWTPEAPESCNDFWSVVRFSLGVLRSREDVRKRFPTALSDAERGGFFTWLLNGAFQGFNPDSYSFLNELARARPDRRVQQCVLCRPNVLNDIPLGLMPSGRRELLRWLFNEGRSEYGFRSEEIWWFALRCAEDPVGSLLLSYRVHPEWQSRFPDGLTLFCRRKFAGWLRRTYGLEDDYTDPARWQVEMTPEEQLRLAWLARPAWQQKFPNALKQVRQAEALIAWVARDKTSSPKAARKWCGSLNRSATARALVSPGLNVIGHFCYPSGLGTSVESIVAGLRLAGLQLSLRDVPVHAKYDEPIHERFIGLEPYDVTLIHVQPEPLYLQAYAAAGLHKRQPHPYRIGYWYWETETVPKSWSAAAEGTNEIWVPTDFVANALRKSFSLPVFTMTPGVQLPSFLPRSRSYFGIPEGRFAFLFVFHMNSVMRRKNPIALIRAFRMAFSKGDSVALVLKTSFGDDCPQMLRELHEAAAGDDAIKIIDAVYSYEETISLMAACDAFVSLHRSEGLGLCLAESMLLAKPVIATGYSGNMDFMHGGNSLLVDYKLVRVSEETSVYEAEMTWAEPSIEHAANLMRKLYDNPRYAADLGAKGRVDIARTMSVEAAGKRMAERIVDLTRRFHSGS